VWPPAIWRSLRCAAVNREEGGRYALSDTTNVHLRVQVEEGSINIYENSCTPNTVGPGGTFIEVPSGPSAGSRRDTSS
jgi:hypothetical protein